MIVCDTGPIVALSNERDEHYSTANNLFRNLHMARETVLVPATVLAEVCYWLNKHGGPEVEAAFLDAVADGTFRLIDLTSEDVARMAERRRALRPAARVPLRCMSPPGGCGRASHGRRRVVRTRRRAEAASTVNV
jgi:predicted nucleic acid-binding protein